MNFKHTHKHFNLPPWPMHSLYHSTSTPWERRSPGCTPQGRRHLWRCVMRPLPLTSPGQCIPILQTLRDSCPCIWIWSSARDAANFKRRQEANWKMCVAFTLEACTALQCEAPDTDFGRQASLSGNLILMLTSFHS